MMMTMTKMVKNESSTKTALTPSITEKKTVLKSILRSITEMTQGIKSNSHQSPDTGADLLAWVLQDDDIRSALEKKHDKLCEIGYFLSGSEKDIKSAQKKLDAVGFDEWYDDSLWHELIFKNSFTEYGSVIEGGKITSLNLIKVDEVEIVNTPKGKILSYVQIPTNPDGKTNMVITLPKDKVFHQTYCKMTTSLWGQSTLKGLIPTLHRKRRLEDFLSWLIESNQFRSVVKIPSGVNADDVDTYLEMLKNGMLNPTNFLVLQGDEAEVTALRTFDAFVGLLKFLDYYQSKINKAFQLPPLEAGNIESSNRSSSEYQVRYAYYSHLKYLLKRKALFINQKMFKKLGIKDVKLIPKMTDDVTVKDALESAQKLLSLNANTEKLNQWLITQGLDIPIDILEEPEEPELVPGQAQEPSNIKKKSEPKLKLDKNSNQHPSRKATENNFAGGSRKK